MSDADVGWGSESFGVPGLQRSDDNGRGREVGEGGTGQTGKSKYVLGGSSRSVEHRVFNAW